MGPTTAVRACLGRYAELTGRAGRAECWWFALATALVVVGVPAVGGLLAGAAGAASSLVGNVLVTVLSLAWALVVLGLVLPAVAAGVRRLHDTDRSGWWFLLALVPVVGTLPLVALLVLAGTPGPNRFGRAAPAA